MSILSLREVRMWHWRQVMTARARALRYQKPYMIERHGNNWTTAQTKLAEYQAKFHLNCVDALNACPELRGSTAEQDWIESLRQAALAKKTHRN